MTAEHKANIAKANAARKGESHACPEGCTCNRHHGYHFGGSKPGRTISDQGRRNIAEAAQNRVYSEETLESWRANRRAQNADPEFEAKRIAGLKNYWANIVSPEEYSRGVKRSSRAEYVLAPYLTALGYQHNEGEDQFRIGRRTPDFVDHDGRRVFEYFGTYWHPDPAEEDLLVDFYAENGWWATVLWEDRCLWWIDDHQHLVTPEEHAEALQVLRPLRKCHPPLAPASPEGYTIHQWEWNDPAVRRIIEQQAPYRSGTSTTIRVGARRCQVQEVNPSDAAAFLDENHIQGRANSSVRIGLIFDEELVALMTFGVPRQQKQDAPVEWELVRYAVKLGHNVPGGASRLFRKFVDTRHPASIVSYSDKEKTTGNLYPILGFSLVNESAPGYVWWNGKVVKRRYECMAYKLKAKYPLLPGIATMSESQIMQKLGYTKILNEGNAVWVWRRGS